ncbi:MAG: FAD-binding oxidoreductase [Armatimonadota bacterium]|nr:FAD-binding oxidoreductase [Armatimonadota bacterium]MDR7563615.1 FAD-binding oxidoreductase [Armatimonadota bacterium]MDR7601220.1 FAD-binding oxidoreductase [Armatimonadota bacterium]
MECGEVVEALRDALGPEKVSITDSVLDAHGRDEGYPEARRPLAVAFAERVADVQAVLRVAREFRTPVIPFGAGTSLEGALIPLGAAISLDLSRMNRILEVQPEDFLAVVEPGLAYTALNRAVRRHGLFFPVDPGAEATLGGMAATNASGTMTVRYGGMRQNVLALQVVLASGEVLELGRGVRKTSSGYDLKDLFIGSEGTLGVITRLVVRLHPLPAYVHTVRAFFPSVLEAAQAAYAIMASGLPVARLELLDAAAMAAINALLHRGYPEQPALFLEFHASSEAAMRQEAETALELAHSHGATSLDVARTPEERSAQWEARHRAYWAFTHQFPGHRFLTTDVAVPLSRLPETVAFAQALLQEFQLPGRIVGHVGDGNFHVLVAVRPEEYHRAEAYSERLVHRALELGGTASGEHGVGLRKRKYLEVEHGPALGWMRRVKALLDPDGILNPGKSAG